jgi:hypothetical protein
VGKIISRHSATPITHQQPDKSGIHLVSWLCLTKIIITPTRKKEKEKKKKKGRIQARDRPRTIYYLGWAIRTLNFYNCIETR